MRILMTDNAGTVFAYGVTSSGKTHTMHVGLLELPFSSSIYSAAPQTQPECYLSSKYPTYLLFVSDNTFAPTFSHCYLHF